jgi:hypothetical protein
MRTPGSIQHDARVKWYAETPAARTRQVTADVFVLLWILLWVWIGMWLHDLIMLLAGPGERLEEAGSGLADNLNGAGERVSDVPLIGDALATPLEGAGAAADQLAQAGQATQEVVGTIALWLSVAFVAVPILLMLLVWLPVRLRFAQQAGAAAALRNDLELFALRALQNRPLHELARISSQPSRALRDDPVALSALAALEMRAVGLRPPTQPVPPQVQ